ncbi:MAG TPA: DEAD/DEAH box helicase [Candidatus Dormibacteraeota bacterium]|nr:DEAD/DEAH box helicase [Candidatus Dormibacteraeota bacterium]
MSAFPLSADRLGALRAELETFAPSIARRGEHYAEEGRVHALRAEPDRVEASVHGANDYRVLWWWNGRRWAHECTCPFGTGCKHAYAVASSLVDGTEGGGADPLDPLARLRDARALWERQAALDELLVEAPAASLTPYGPPLEDLLREPDADTRCWRLAAAIAEEADGWVPEPLQPYLVRGDVANRFRDRERAATAAALLEWARQRGAHPPRRLRVVLSLLAGADGVPALAFEVRLTTPRVHDAPRTVGQLHGLRTECLRDPGLFPPEQANLLTWLADQAQPSAAEWNGTRLQVTRPMALLERVAAAGVGEWGDTLDAALAIRAGVTSGAPVRVGRADVRVVPANVGAGEELTLDLRVRWDDGSERGLAEVLYVPAEPGAGRGSLVLRDGEAFAVADEPPAALRTRFEREGPLPVPRQERAPLMRTLAEAFPHLHETLTAHTCIHAVAPSVALDLRTDDWLQMRVFARSGRAPWNPSAPLADEAVLFELSPERGWVRAGRHARPAPDFADLSGSAETAAGGAPTAEPPTAAAGEAWIELPDPATVAPLSAWVRMLPLTSAVRAGAPDANGVGWWMRVARRTLEAFGEAWEQRPPGIAFFGTSGIRRLLGVSRIGAPRLRVRASGVDWLTVSADWEAEGLRLDEADLAALRSASGPFVKLDAGWVRRDLIEEHDDAAELLADLGISLDEGEQRVSVWQLAGASEDGLAHLATLGVDAETLAAVEDLRQRVAAFTGIETVPLPAGLTATLRPYQRHGLDFLAHTARLGLGAVLADDMGLGKTVQALAWLLHLRVEDPDGGPVLVVCPASVVHNWAREAARFAPELRVLLLTSGKERHALREEIPAHDLVITTYALLRRDIEDWTGVPLRAAVLDEAQFIKNPDAAVARAALALNAKHRLALTGTPLENRALDLWSIMQFCNPGYLGGRGAFVRRVDRPDAPPHVRALLAAKLRPVLLRRSKGAVAPELPPRIEERRDCELTTEQRQLYLAELKKSRTLLTQINSTDRFAKDKLHVLAALTRLRQICCHPALAGGRPDLASGKFEALFEMLEPLLAEGHKVLVFSQFVQCLKLLQTALRARGVRFHTLTGATTKRDQVVSGFQDDPEPCVFLISLKAGGTGLNLTAASYVVLFDPWWNPAVEAQAIDRTHRIGQDRTVIAYRMLTLGTIEERIWELQQRKSTLVRDVLGEGGFSRALTRDDLEYLLADVTAI